jgi:hypothetical protein
MVESQTRVTLLTLALSFLFCLSLHSRDTIYLGDQLDRFAYETNLVSFCDRESSRTCQAYQELPLGLKAEQLLESMKKNPVLAVGPNIRLTEIIVKGKGVLMAKPIMDQSLAKAWLRSFFRVEEIKAFFNKQSGISPESQLYRSKLKESYFNLLSHTASDTYYSFRYAPDKRTAYAAANSAEEGRPAEYAQPERVSQVSSSQRTRGGEVVFSGASVARMTRFQNFLIGFIVILILLLVFYIYRYMQMRDRAEALEITRQQLDQVSQDRDLKHKKMNEALKVRNMLAEELKELQARMVALEVQVKEPPTYG